VEFREAAIRRRAECGIVLQWFADADAVAAVVEDRAAALDVSTARCDRRDGASLEKGRRCAGPGDECAAVEVEGRAGTAAGLSVGVGVRDGLHRERAAVEIDGARAGAGRARGIARNVELAAIELAAV